MIAVALSWKLVWLSLNRISFNSDEAIVGLMAKHILGGEHPLFFYGQAYMGSLDAHLVAGGFLVFGVKVWVIRFIQVLLYLATIFIVMKITEVLFQSEKITFAAGILLAVPTVNVHLYTTVSLGGYGEALLIGCAILLIWLNYRKDRENKPVTTKRMLTSFFLIGSLSGIGVWANALSLVFTAPVLLMIIYDVIFRHKEKKSLLIIPLLLISVLAGLLPYWIAILKSGFSVYFHEMLGSAIAVETGSWLVIVGNHLRNFILLGIPVIFGFRPPWTVTWLILPLIPIVLFLWIFIFGRMRKVFRINSLIAEGVWILVGVMIFSLLGFIFTSFGNDPSGRYFIAFAVPLSILASSVAVISVPKKIWTWVIIGILFMFNLGSTIQSGWKQNPGFTTQFYEPSEINHAFDQHLIQFLIESGETKGYSNYWVSYPIAFLSNEAVIFVPQLPYHLDLVYTNRDDRYLPYDKQVEQSSQVAYITTRNPALDQSIVKSLQAKGATYLEKQIGDYHVFYHLSKRIDPYILGLIKSE